MLQALRRGQAVNHGFSGVQQLVEQVVDTGGNAGLPGGQRHEVLCVAAGVETW